MEEWGAQTQIGLTVAELAARLVKSPIRQRKRHPLKYIQFTEEMFGIKLKWYQKISMLAEILVRR